MEYYYIIVDSCGWKMAIETDISSEDAILASFDVKSVQRITEEEYIEAKGGNNNCVLR